MVRLHGQVLDGQLDFETVKRDRQHPIRTAVFEWMSRYFDENCENAPNSDRRFLPPVCKTDVWRLCQRDLKNRSSLQGQSLNYAYFVQLWQDMFKNVVIPHQSKKGHCSECQTLKERIRRASLQGDKNALRLELAEHRELVAKERQHYHHIRETAGGETDDHDSMSWDAMDWNHTSIPHHPEGAKDLEASFEKYRQKLTGGKVHGIPRPYFLFYNNQSVKPDTNLNIHIMLQMLRNLGRPIKKKLHILLDNTVAGNKTIRLFGFIAILVQYGLVDEVRATVVGWLVCCGGFRVVGFLFGWFGGMVKYIYCCCGVGWAGDHQLLAQGPYSRRCGSNLFASGGMAQEPCHAYPIRDRRHLQNLHEACF